MGLAVSLVLAYYIIVSSVETNVLKTQLNQVAEYVSMSISNVISLVDFTYGKFKENVTVSKSLNLPTDLSGKAYIVRLVNETGGFYVLAEIPGRSDLYAKSPIPIRSSVNIQIVKERIAIIREHGIIMIPEDFTIKPSNYIYGGNPNAVVWCEYGGNTLYIGLGLRGSGGE